MQLAGRRTIRILALPVGMALLLATTDTNAQQTPQQAPPGGPSAYRLLRYGEDYRYLQEPARRSDPWGPIKYIQIGLRAEADRIESPGLSELVMI
jgi:hypothetical protein